MKRKLSALLLALIMLLALLPQAFTAQVAVADSAPIDQNIVEGGAILHCFDWSYKEIIDHLDEIAAAGYTAVQTSPVQPAKDYNASWNDTRGNWWKLYQPLDFRIAGEGETWLCEGGKTLADLCEAAHGKQIKVIVDVVANHTANKSGGGVLKGGEYNVSPQVAERLQDPDGTRGIYHWNEEGVNDDSRYNMTQYQMDLPDLNTGNRVVQDMVLDFLKECVNCGVDGFRFDAAKHIELPGDSGCGSDFWPYVLNGVRNYAENDLYIYGESLSGSGSGSYGGGGYDAWIDEFITYMALTDSKTSGDAREAVSNQNAGLLAVSGYYRGNSPRNYVLWAESHDTYLGNDHTDDISSDKIIQIWAIVGARADSTALYLARPNDRMGLASSDTSWKSPAVTAVNKFKKHYDGKGEYFSYNQDAKITWLERGTSGGDAGVSIVKLDGPGWVELDAHLMSDGVYKDAVTGNTFGVQNGKIFGNVGPTGVAVVYETTTGELPTPPSSTTRTLYLRPNSNWKQIGDGVQPRFAIYAFGNGEHWYSMNAVDGVDGLWSAEISSSDPNVIFCRMNGNTTDNNWSNKYNQTGDLAVPSDKNLFTLAEGVWDGATETWGVYGDVGGGDDPTPVTEDEGYYIVGNFTGWAISPEFKMTRTGADTDEYSIEIPLTRTSSYNSRFKVVYSPDGVTKRTWYPSGDDNNYGDYWDKQNKTGEIPQSGVYTVYFRPNGDGGSDWHDGCIFAKRTKFFVTVNNTDKNGTVTVDKDVAAAGETVTVTVTPNKGYVLDTLVYMCETGFNTGTFDTTEITGNTFQMPTENAVVKATFKAIPKFESCSVVLSGQIGMNFYMTIPEEYTNHEVTFTINAGEKNKEVTVVGEAQADGRYKFTCYLTSVEMTDQITAVYNYEVDGEPTTASMVTSIQGYLNKIIENKENDPEFTRAYDLAKALWTYGYYAHDAVTDGPNHERMDYGNVNVIGDPSIEGFDLNAYKGSEVAKITYSLSLDSETALNIYLTPAGDAEFTKDNVIVRKETEIYENYIVEKVGARYRVKITGIGAHELGTGFNVDVGTRANTTISNVSVVSIVKKYLANNTIKAETKDAATALYYYYQAAIEYSRGN